MKLPAIECDSWCPSAPVRNRNTGLATRRRFIYMRDLLITLVGRDMRLRGRFSPPLAQLAVPYLTFDVLLPLNVPNCFTFLFYGLLVWN
jgi:hypothetical protein